MNRIYRTVWNAARGQWQVAPENVKRHGKTSRRSGIVGTLASLTAGSIILLPLCAFASGLPTGGEIRAGSGSIKQSGNAMRINQNSDRMAMDWDDFSVAEGHRVEFHQPGRDAAALNRVTGDQLSQIRGAIEANGQVFLVNPNGIVFGDTAQVDVGGLVASTLDISPDDFMAGDFTFEGNSSSAIINQGNIRAADEGYVALIATEIINEGSIKAPRGDVMMGAGSRVTLDMGGPIKIEVEEALLDTYIEQGGAIQADGGRVYLTAKAAGDLAASVINHTGTTQARTLAENAQGEIWLMGDMQSGETRVAGTLDASAPDGGDGGFVETSAAKVRFMDEVTVTTQAAQGKTGELLIDPSDYTVAPSGGDITGESLSDLLSRTTATLSTDEWGSGGNGDIFVNDEVSWSNSNQLTLNALRNIEINKTIQGGGKLVLKYGQANNGGEYQINAPIDLPAGQNFSTQLGSDDGNRINYTVITEYSSGSRTSLNNLQGTGSHLSGNYALGADIDASSTGSAWYNSWNPIGDHDSPFTGNFNGLSHTISDLNIDSDSDDYLGLFGSASSTSIIRDIGLVGGNIKGGTRLGGLVGFNAGDIINAYTTGSVNGTGRIGGLVGFNEGNIVRAHATGEATGSGRDVYDGWRVGGLVGHNIGTITHSYATGHVKGDIHAGGLVGSNTGTITKAYATGNVETPSSDGMFAGGLVGINDDGRITNAYATGDVVGDRNVGGLVGRNDTQAHNLVTIRNSYATGKATGNSDVGGLVGDGLGYVFRVVIDSYYATTRANGNPINGANSSGEGTGKSYAELTKLGTFRSAWGSDIDAHGGTDAVWRIYDGHTTPMLRSFLTPVTVTPDSNEIVGKVYDGDAASGIADYATDVSGATLDGNSLTYTTDAADAGTYDSLNFSGLYSHQQGYDISYDSAASVTIDSRPLTINGTTAQDKTYDGSTDATITVGTLNNLVAGEDLSVAATGSFSSADAGQRNVNARYILSNGNNGLASNYTTPTDSTHFATINKASLTVAAKDDSKTYDGQTYSGGNGVTYSGFVNNEGENKLGGSLAYRGTSQGATNANTYDIKPEGLSATNYDLTFESGKLTIDPRSLTISGTTVANKVYDGSTDATVTAGAMDNLATDENLSIDASGSFDNANAGSRTVTASYTLNDGTNGLANNYRLADTTHAATINRRLLTITGTTAEDKVYDGSTDATVTAGVLDNLVTDENLSIDASGSFDNANAGSRTVTASYTLNDGTNGLANNYWLADTTHAATINRRLLTITGTNAEDKVYDGTTDATLSGTATLDNVVPNDNVSIGTTGTGNFNDKNVADNKPVTVSGYALTGADAGNYSVTQPSSLSANVTPAPLTVITDNDSKTYGDNDPTFTWQVTNGNLIGDDILAGDLTREAGEDAGDYAISAADFSNGNYLITAQDGVLTIDPRAITVSADDQSITYGENDPTLTWQITDGNLMGDDSLAGDLTREAGEDAGDYAISVADLANGNYLITAQDGVLTIDPRSITITADDQNKTYGNDDPSITWQVTNGNLVGDDSLAGDLTREAGEDAGDYAISVADLANGNYLITAQDGVLTIDPRAITVTADDQNKTYGNDDPTFTWQVTDGSLVGDDSLAGDLTREVGEDVNDYAISAADLANGNYVITAQDGILTIDPRPITVAADDQSKIYGMNDPKLTWQVIEGNLIDNDTLSGNLTRATGEIAGNYSISPTDLANSNYFITSQDGTLSIKQGANIDAAINQALQAASSSEQEERMRQVNELPNGNSLLPSGIEIIGNGISIALNDDAEGDN